MDDFAAELEEIKREIVESRALSIKTNNLVNALSADVGSIAKRQRGYERKISWNSAAAYVMTSIVLLLAGKVVVDARVEAERAQSHDRIEKLGLLEQEIENLRLKHTTEQQDERQIQEYMGLIQAEKREEVLRRWPEVQKLNLSATERSVFEREVETTRGDLSLAAYHEGLDHERAGRWHEAEESFRRSLKVLPNAVHSPATRLELARCLKTLGRQREAIPLLIDLGETSTDVDLIGEALYLLAQSQIDIEAWNDAKATLRGYLHRFPTSAKSNEIRIRLGELQLHH